MKNRDPFEDLVEELTMHARDTSYAVYALECTPNWDLPTLEDPRLDGARYKQDSFPLTDMPKSIVAKSNYQQCKVYDGADPDREYPSWKFLADAASKVYYVGHTEDLQSRIDDHEKGTAADFTEEATIESVHTADHHLQNLRDDLLDAVEATIEQKSENASRTHRQDIMDLRHLRASIEARANVSSAEARWVHGKYRFDEIKRVCNDAKAYREKKEAELAIKLRNPSAPHSSTGLPRSDERISIDDIETFAYWA